MGNHLVCELKSNFGTYTPKYGADGEREKKTWIEMSFNRFVIQCIGQSASANALENSIESDAAE